MPKSSEYIRVKFVYNQVDSDGDIIKPGAFNTGKNKIKIAPNKTINTAVFEDAIVLEENGALTKEGLKEYKGDWVSESELKPIINFLNQ